MNSEELHESYGEPEGLNAWGISFGDITAGEVELAADSGVDQFDELADEIHPINVEKGFWADPVMMDKYVAKLCLIHSEVSEVMEALRKSQGSDKVTEEFADILIRLFDLYGTLRDAGEADGNLYEVMKNKIEVNAKRPPKHGNRWG